MCWYPCHSPAARMRPRVDAEATCGRRHLVGLCCRLRALPGTTVSTAAAAWKAGVATRHHALRRRCARSCCCCCCGGCGGGVCPRLGSRLGSTNRSREPLGKRALPHGFVDVAGLPARVSCMSVLVARLRLVARACTAGARNVAAWGVAAGCSCQVLCVGGRGATHLCLTRRSACRKRDIVSVTRHGIDSWNGAPS